MKIDVIQIWHPRCSFWGGGAWSSSPKSSLRELVQGRIFAPIVQPVRGTTQPHFHYSNGRTMSRAQINIQASSISNIALHFIFICREFFICGESFFQLHFNTTLYFIFIFIKIIFLLFYFNFLFLSLLISLFFFLSPLRWLTPHCLPPQSTPPQAETHTTPPKYPKPRPTEAPFKTPNPKAETVTILAPPPSSATTSSRRPSQTP